MTKKHENLHSAQRIKQLNIIIYQLSFLLDPLFKVPDCLFVSNDVMLILMLITVFFTY